jgi:hypothetical protein
MSTKKVSTKVCDVDGCKIPASFSCAKCGVDLCRSEHTHNYADGGHIEHAVRVDICDMKSQGDHRIYFCPKCYVDTGLWKMINDHGKHVEGTGGYHAGETMG